MRAGIDVLFVAMILLMRMTNKMFGMNIMVVLSMN